MSRAIPVAEAPGVGPVLVFVAAVFVGVFGIIVMRHANTSTLEETRIESVVHGSDAVDGRGGARSVVGRQCFAVPENGVQRRAVATLQSLRLVRADEAETDGGRYHTPESRIEVEGQGFASLETQPSQGRSE
jgi:hypothetical protein